VDEDGGKDAHGGGCVSSSASLSPRWLPLGSAWIGRAPPRAAEAEAEGRSPLEGVANDSGERSGGEKAAAFPTREHDAARRERSTA